jgi:hypothetical protein
VCKYSFWKALYISHWIMIKHYKTCKFIIVLFLPSFLSRTCPKTFLPYYGKGQMFITHICHIPHGYDNYFPYNVSNVFFPFAKLQIGFFQIFNLCCEWVSISLFFYWLPFNSCTKTLNETFYVSEVFFSSISKFSYLKTFSMAFPRFHQYCYPFQFHFIIMTIKH